MTALAHPRAAGARNCAAADYIDSTWPTEEPDEGQPISTDDDDHTPMELEDDYWEALAPDDDYEPLPEPGDFWTED